jgi:hypothetical protein
MKERQTSWNMGQGMITRGIDKTALFPLFNFDFRVPARGTCPEVG